MKTPSNLKQTSVCRVGRFSMEISSTATSVAKPIYASIVTLTNMNQEEVKEADAQNR